MSVLLVSLFEKGTVIVILGGGFPYHIFLFASTLRNDPI